MIESASVTVATTATALNVAEGSASDRVSVLVAVPTGGATVFVGGSGVTTANGYPITAGTSIALDLNSGEVAYGIVAASTQAVAVLRSGVG